MIDKMLVKTTLNRATDQELFVALESMGPRLRASAIRAFASAWIRSGGVHGTSGRQQLHQATVTSFGQAEPPVVVQPDAAKFSEKLADQFSNF